LMSVKNNGHNFKQVTAECSSAFAGFIIPFMLTAFYFARHDALGDWYFWNIGWASIYAGYKPWYVKIWYFFYGFIVTWQWLPFSAAAFYAVYRILKSKIYRRSNFAFFVVALFFAGALCKLVMNKPHSRYYLYFLPGIFFAAVYGVAQMKGKVRVVFTVSASIFIAVTLAVANVNGWKKPYDRSFQARANLRSWIVGNISSDKTLWIWGEGYEVYYETKRKKSKCSFFSSKEDLDKSRLWKDNKYRNTAFMWERFLSEFTANPPDYIADYTLDFGYIDWEPSDGVREGAHKEYYDRFRAFVDRQYTVAAVIDGRYRILRRRGSL